MRKQKHTTQQGNQRGFTLIEIMIVVAIIAALAAVAITAYTRHIKSGRLVNARTFVSQIQARQAAYFQQFGQYANASHSTGGGVNFYPVLVNNQEPKAKLWAPTLQGWKDLGVRPSDNYTYASVFVRASRPDTTTPANNHAFDGSLAASVQIPAQPTATGSTKHPWWYVVAHLDLDGQGASYSTSGCSGGTLTTTVCTVMWASSAHEQIVVLNQGK